MANTALYCVFVQQKLNLFLFFNFKSAFSGMLVQDPTRANDVDAIFDQARQSAVEGPLDQLRPSSSSKAFTGTARLLSGESVQSAPAPPETVSHNITFWRNGFTVDDGPLRRLDDPANASFLEVIFSYNGRDVSQSIMILLLVSLWNLTVLR